MFNNQSAAKASTKIQSKIKSEGTMKLPSRLDRHFVHPSKWRRQIVANNSEGREGTHQDGPQESHRDALQHVECLISSDQEGSTNAKCQSGKCTIVHYRKVLLDNTQVASTSFGYCQQRAVSLKYNWGGFARILHHYVHITKQRVN